MFFLVGETIDMQDLKDLKRGLSQVCSRGTGPRATVKKSVLLTVGRGPVPRYASIGRNGVGWRAFFARGEQSRGTGPRATGPEGVLLSMRRSGAGVPELQSPAPLLLIVEIVEILLLSC